MTPEQYVTLRDAISAHIEHEAKRSGTYHGDPAATPGGTGYCIPAAVATGIVDKYLLDFRAAPRAEGHHNRDGCNPYDESHIAGKAGAEPPRCPCPDHVGPENAHPLSESAAPPACDGSCYNDPANCLHTEGAAPRAEGPTDEERAAFKRSEWERIADLHPGAPRAEGLPSVEALAESLHDDWEETQFGASVCGEADREAHIIVYQPIAQRLLARLAGTEVVE